jgi:hypothetical protein
MYQIGLGVPSALRRPLFLVRDTVRLLGFYGGRQSRQYMRFVHECESRPGYLSEKVAELDAAVAAGGPLAYYVMPSAGAKEGLFQQVNALVHTHLVMALVQGRVPVVDMQSEKNQYLAADKVGRENSWEYFFEQPYGIGLDSIPSGADVVRGHFRTHWGVWKGDPSRDFGMREETRSQLYMLCERFVRPTPVTARTIEENRQALFSPGDTVLGVVIRETDYALQMEHHRPADGQIDYIAQIRDALGRHGCNTVFVATESRRVFDSVGAAFPGIVRTNPREFYDRYYQDRADGRALVLADVRHDRENDEYLRGLEYVTTVFLLAGCDVLLGTRSGAFTAAQYLNRGAYSHVSTWA